MRRFLFASMVLSTSCLLAACGGDETGTGGGGGDGGSGANGGGGGGGGIVAPPGEIDVAIVFVSRQIQEQGSIYWDVPKDMPGVGAHSRVRPAAPGRLVVHEPDGTERVLVDGGAPGAATMGLVDVNGPSVSYDGQTIVFAGLPEGDHDTSPARSIGAWRIFAIEADGTGLRQLTPSGGDDLDLSQFGDAAGGLAGFDDFDPVFLPDGRVCFASTRFPEYGQYSGVRASNLYVMNADGTGIHRITSERNGADRPLVDPLTGKIVYARWWRNHRFPVDSMETALLDEGDPSKGYLQKDGLTSDRDDPVGGPSMFRNAWQAATIAPDGTELAMWSGRLRDEEANHVYGGAFSEDGALYASYFPMYNMTEASGFGGIRRYERGANEYTPVLGVTTLTLEYVSEADPTSYGIFEGVYASEPEVLPDGRLVVSMAADVGQDYGLYVVKPDGSELKALVDAAGTSELRARVLAPRAIPPVWPDVFLEDPELPLAPLLPPTETGPFDATGTFVFDALNVYANAPVDTDIVSAIPVGSAGTIRFFVDHQRTSPGSFPGLDWPILLGEKEVAPDGSVQDPAAPAYLPLFEQIRSPAPDYAVPLTGGANPDGAAHVAGMNFGVPGAVAQCVGCHAGHTMIGVHASGSDAKFSNLAPGAAVTVSSTRDAEQDRNVVDRRVMKGEIWRTWTSAQDETEGQWVLLTFAVPVTVRVVRLYSPRPGDEANSSLAIAAATVRLFSDAAATTEVAAELTGPVEVSGTDLEFGDVKARSVLVELDEVSGTFYGMKVAGLAEIEVIARGEAP